MRLSLGYVSALPSKSQIDYSCLLSSALYLLLLSLLFYCRLIGPRSAGCTSLQLLRDLAPHHQTFIYLFIYWFGFFCLPFDFLLITLVDCMAAKRVTVTRTTFQQEAASHMLQFCRPAGLQNSFYCSGLHGCFNGCWHGLKNSSSSCFEVLIVKLHLLGCTRMDGLQIPMRS